MVIISKLKTILLIFLIWSTIPSLNGCQNGIIISENDTIYPTIYHSCTCFNVCIGVKDNSALIKDCAPEFVIFTDQNNLTAMSFSGDGKNWSEWVDFKEEYDQFNIANGLNGTSMDSGKKIIYIRFKNNDGIIYPQAYHEPIFCEFEYEMQKLFSIRIEPGFAEMQPGDTQQFLVKGYDLLSKNEVPLDRKKVVWSKPCAIGELNPVAGLHTTYTAPQQSGVRNISVHYGSLGAGAKVYVEKQ